MHKIDHSLHSYLDQISSFNGFSAFKRSELYQKLAPEIEKLFLDFETGDFTTGKIPEKKSYRAVAWNLERGMVLEGIIDTFKNHPILKDADFVLASETDLGMARSGNRNVSKEIAEALGFHYFFAPCYLNLSKGSGLEADVESENTLGLHGNSIFSRYPLKDFSWVQLRNNKDKMKGKEKRLGSQRALVASACLPGGDLRLVCVHLDAHSSKRHRRDQIREILAFLEDLPKLPTLLGGDFNTLTYNSRHAAFAIFGFWVRVAIGVRYVIREHYPYPDRFFERALFRSLEKSGFDYKKFNVPGACTLHYDVEDLKRMRNLKDWIPNWCFRFIEWALKEQNGRCSFKIDWFAGKDLTVMKESPKVIGDLKWNGREISDHDAIVVDFTLGQQRQDI